MKNVSTHARSVYSLCRGTIYSSAALLLLALSLPMGVAHAATSSSTNEGAAYLFSFGNTGPSEDQVVFPFALAINPNNGDTYVLNADVENVVEYASDGTYITQWGSEGTGNGQFEFEDPSGIAINSHNGNVYVSDDGNERVQEFTSDGTYITQWGSEGTGNGQFEGPFGVTLNPTSGNVYVADEGQNRVQEFTSSGTYVTQWGSVGTGNGQFDEPVAVAVNTNNGDVYVTDANNHRIQEFTSDGTYITQWGSEGTSNGQFESPFGVTVDPLTGNVYVVDLNADNVQEFTSDGTYITQWGSEGTSNGQFTEAFGIAFDPMNGTVAITDGGNSRVEVFGQDQNLAQETAPGSSNLVNLTLPLGSNITNESVARATTNDPSYTYPLGLLNFTFTTPNNVHGASVPVQITFQTNLNPSQVKPRKYDPTTKTYTAIPNATVTETTVNGKPALLVSYTITDGSSLDQDGTANGVIVDPVGLAATSSTPTAPSTGYGAPVRPSSSMIILANFGLVLVGAGLAYRRTELSDQAR